jgi:hypothetical protein
MPKNPRPLNVQVTKRFACFMEIRFETDELLEEGSKRMQPDTINVQWGRTGDSPWQVVSVSTAGNRVVKPRGGELEVREERIIFRYEELGFVPRWIMNTIMSNIPSRA